MSLVGRLASLAALASLGALLALCTSYAMCLHAGIDARVFGGAPGEPCCVRLARRPACIVDFICCVSIVSLMSASLLGRLASLAALAALGALLALWTSHLVSLHVVIDACVFGGPPREPRRARLARRHACAVDFICYVSSCCY